MTRFDGAATFTGNVVFGGTVRLPAGAVDSENVEAGANVSADKLSNRHAIRYSQPDGSDVASETKSLHICRTAGTIKSVEIRPSTAPSGGGDKAYTVDVQKAADGGAYSSVLSSAETVSEGGSADNTKQSATLNGTPTVAAGDAIRVVIATSGSTGNQGQGVVVVITVDENGV